MANTPRFDLEKPADGATDWDTPLNSNFDKIDAAAKTTDITSAVDTHTALANAHHAQSHTHASHTSVGTDDHHAQSHSHTSHTGIGVNDHHTETHAAAKHTDQDFTGITDGQLVAWNTSLGKFIPASPTGNAEIAYAENVTTTITTVAGTTGALGTAIDIPNCSISVPANTRAVWIEGKCSGVQSVAGAGDALLQLWETTSGDTAVEWTYQFLPNTTSNRGKEFVLTVKARIGVTTGTRTFKLMARCDSIAANTPSWTVSNGLAVRSFIHAWAE